jgi:hypothetical protein
MEKLKFEQGPIRPPNESRSFLLRVTRNCPWNQCMFCPVYKGRKFSLRTVEEIKQDILTAREMADNILELSRELGFNEEINSQVISHVLNSPDYSVSYRSVAVWLYYGTGACFLQDADNLIMKTDDLVEVLKFLREKFPEITRVTSYSRSRTIATKSIEDLKNIRKAGLNRVHVGLESGCDQVLKAGMELSEYVMPGLGGQELWYGHAADTAKVLNEINPDFIRLRSLRVPDRVPLSSKVKDGTFTMQSDDMLAEEIRLFIEALDNINSIITSDHIMNLLEEVSGKLPEDKDKMLGVIDRYQNLSDGERLIYRVGRRGGAYHSIDDLNSDPDTRKKLESLIQQIDKDQGQEGIEKFINDMVDQYI